MNSTELIEKTNEIIRKYKLDNPREFQKAIRNAVYVTILEMETNKNEINERERNKTKRNKNKTR
ncbi:MAG: hypothetical protein MJ168_10975 [Clostridia bacterium]|nr:hypothetical protein [Clostridia bacterium]